MTIKIKLLEITSLNGEKVVSYKYDELGRRNKKTTPLKEITYVYSGNDVILEKIKEILSQEITEKIYYYEGKSSDDIFRMDIIKDGVDKSYYYTKNYQNSVVSLTDSNGNIVEKYLYDVFGKPLLLFIY